MLFWNYIFFISKYMAFDWYYHTFLLQSTLYMFLVVFIIIIIIKMHMCKALYLMVLYPHWTILALK